MKSARRAIDGVLLMDKPAGLSSGGAVGWARRLLAAEKGGHTGTLDPFATGLLPICLGEATKFSRFMLDADKGYRATLRLGETSSTGDTEGEITRRCPVTVTRPQVESVLATFLGARTQVPPMHSALKRDGVPLYKLARQGVEVERQPRAITVRRLDIVSLDGTELVIDTLVSKGTYIRVLAADIGEALGCGAHLVALRRTSTGGFDVAAAVSPDALESLDMRQREDLLLPPIALAEALPGLRLDVDATRALCNGQKPFVGHPVEEGAIYRATGADGRFLGVVVAHRDEQGRAFIVAERLMDTSGAYAQTD